MAYSENKEYSFLAASSSGIAAGLRVKLDGDLKLVVAGVADSEIGVTRSMSSNGTDPVRVLLKNAPGTTEMVAGGVIAVGATVKRAASGKIVADGAGYGIGVAMQASAADGDIIEVLPFPPTDTSDAVIVALASTNGNATAAAPSALTSVNGAVAAVNSTAVAPIKTDFDSLLGETEKIGDDVRGLHAKYTLLVAEAEKVGDDVRAIHAALVTKGILAAA
jgi:hypothetical protein